ncbi:MAG: hypothetical protein FIA93_07945 [Deltaproteobacteria bacterium]|nr:hypothetical protein [Deltaproteobacteria bacterium]
MNRIGWDLLLNLYFWIFVASGVLFLGVWACIEIFLGAAQKARKTLHVVRGQKASPHPSPGAEDVEEWYGNAS